MKKSKKTKKIQDKKNLKQVREEAQESAFIREVDEDVQQEKFHQLLKKYGVLVGALIAVIILIVIGLSVYRSVRENAILDEADKFQKMVVDVDLFLKDGKYVEAKILLEKFADDAKYDYKDVAYTMLFELYLKTDRAGLVDLLDKVKDEANSEKIRDFATFNLAILKYEANKNFEELEKGLKCLIKDKDSFYRHNSFLVIINTAIVEKKYDIAEKYISKLEKEKDLPVNIVSSLNKFRSLIITK